MSSNQTNESRIDFSRTAYLLVTLISIVVICVYTQEYVIPFIIALLIWFIIHELRENIQMVPFMRKHFPMWVQSSIAFLIICAVLIGVGKLLMISVSELTVGIDDYKINFEIAMFQLSSTLGMDVMSQISGFTETIDITSLLAEMADFATVIFGDAFLILLYVLFLLIEESIFHYKLEAMYQSDEKMNKTTKLFQKMDKNMSSYLSLKTLVSLMTGVLSYFALLLFGLDAPIFWAMLIFVLNYIPTVGSLIATVFPAVFAIFQFGEFGPFIYILVAVGIIQVIVGNIIEPKIMGNSLNISSLVVVLSLTIWGAIWGVMGMILSVPITVMMIIVFEEIPSLRFIAIMLSEKGDLNIDDSADPQN